MVLVRGSRRSAEERLLYRPMQGETEANQHIFAEVNERNVLKAREIEPFYTNQNAPQLFVSSF